MYSVEQQRIQSSTTQGKANPEIYVIFESESNKSKDHKYNPRPNGGKYVAAATNSFDFRLI